jgi:ATP-dependent Clp protease ATP-binding subunit ClpA
MTKLGMYREKFAETGLRVFERSIEESRLRKQNYVTLAHILKSLAPEDTTAFVQLIRDLGKQTPLSEDLVESIVESGPDWRGRGVRLAPDVIRLLQLAMVLALAAGHARIEAQHLFLAFERINRSWAIFFRIGTPHSLVVRT